MTGRVRRGGAAGVADDATLPPSGGGVGGTAMLDEFVRFSCLAAGGARGGRGGFAGLAVDWFEAGALLLVLGGFFDTWPEDLEGLSSGFPDGPVPFLDPFLLDPDVAAAGSEGLLEDGGTFAFFFSSFLEEIAVW